MAEIKFLDEQGNPLELGWFDEVIDFTVGLKWVGASAALIQTGFLNETFSVGQTFLASGTTLHTTYRAPHVVSAKDVASSSFSVGRLYTDTGETNHADVILLFPLRKKQVVAVSAGGFLASTNFVHGSVRIYQVLAGDIIGQSITIPIDSNLNQLGGYDFALKLSAPTLSFTVDPDTNTVVLA